MWRLSPRTAALLCVGALFFSNITGAAFAERLPENKGSICPIASADGSFVILNDGTLMACGNGLWGTNAGAYGAPDEAISFEKPNKIMEGAVFVTAGQFAAMAIDRNGTLWGWGSDIKGQLLGFEGGGLTPLMEDVSMADIGNSHVVALKKDGTVWAWGKNSSGQLAEGTIGTEQGKFPQRQVMSDGIAVLASGDASYVVKADGSLWGWGGGVPFLDGPAAAPVKLFDEVVSVSTTDSAVLILKEDGSFWQVDKNGEPEDITKVMDDVAWCGYGVAIQSDGSLWIWRPDAEGPVPPRKVMEDVVFAAMGIDETIVLTDLGELWVAPFGSGAIDEDGEFTFALDNVLLPQTANHIRCLPYEDVSAWDWFYKYAKASHEGKLLVGVGANKFSPYVTLTEQEAVTIAVRLHQKYVPAGAIVPNVADWFAPYQEYALSVGILTQEEAAPADVIATRFRVVELLGRAIPEENLAPLTETLIDIPDVDEASAEGRTILRFYQAGILTGADNQGNFCGEQSITRAEVSAIVSRIMKADLRVHR